LRYAEFEVLVALFEFVNHPPEDGVDLDEVGGWVGPLVASHGFFSYLV
jgi:hypothetical protein